MDKYLPCPKCNGTNIEKLSYTWWGGAIGPSILHHVKCKTCNYQYNGKTGKSNKREIEAYTTTSIIITIIAVYYIFFILLK